jgi:CubicO group peptidase (beta-lactamase class C family)
MGYGMLIVPEANPPFLPPYPVVTAATDLDLVLGPPDPRTPHDPDEWLRRFGTLPLMAQPGERWLYNAGLLVLGVLLARAAGQPLGDLLRARLFEPLGMTDTGFTLPAADAARLPVQYMADPTTGRLAAQDLTGPGYWAAPPVFPSAAAGLVSTVDDYHAFARLLLDRGVSGGRRLLSEDAVAALTTNHLTPDQVAAAGPLLGGLGWGYGMAVGPDRYGWDGGSGTSWFNDPGRGLVAIALTQVSDFMWNGGMADFKSLASA